MSEPDVLTEVPEALKKLVRMIMRGFYGNEHAIVTDYLMHHPCIKEDDLLDLIKFERKQLRAVINSLKLDHFIKTRLRVETDAEGKTTKHNYYFVCYNAFVNVVKYKLDHVRRKIDTEERDLANRASFVCPECSKQFTDLEVGQLMDLTTGRLLCTFCEAEVKDDLATPGEGGTEETRGDARTLMVKFNEQIEVIYSLLRDVERVKLSAKILEPEPQDFKSTRNAGGARGAADGQQWSGQTHQGGINMQTHITITTGEADADKTETVKKETPIWMSHSTVDGTAIGRANSSAPSSDSTKSSSRELTNRQNSSDDIMRTLLSHEKRASVPTSALTTGGSAAFNDGSSTSDSDDDTATYRQRTVGSKSVAVDEMDTDGGDDAEDGDNDHDVTVTVAGVRYSYHEVTQDMVATMTAAEKQDYIRIGTELYQDLYD